MKADGGIWLKDSRAGLWRCGLVRDESSVIITQQFLEICVGVSGVEIFFKARREVILRERYENMSFPNDMGSSVGIGFGCLNAEVFDYLEEQLPDCLT